MTEESQRLLKIIESEPNYEVFTASNFICEIIRHPNLGHYCGYVHVPDNHLLYEKEDINVNVHGGVTLTEHSIIGEWIVGFDCGHSGDYSPMMSTLAYHSLTEESYKDYNFVKSEVESLAHQLAQISPSEDVDQRLAKFLLAASKNERRHTRN